jgi:DNA-binding XRE family transcriptional regulator
MSEHMRRSHTDDSIEVTIKDATKITFSIPREASAELFTFLYLHQIGRTRNDLVPSEKVFRDLDKKYGKVGVTIKGFRVRDGLTQLELANKLHIHQVHVSQIENGKRTVGKKLAQKLAKIFRTDYRLFL